MKGASQGPLIALIHQVWIAGLVIGVILLCSCLGCFYRRRHRRMTGFYTETLITYFEMQICLKSVYESSPLLYTEIGGFRHHHYGRHHGGHHRGGGHHGGHH